MGKQAWEILQAQNELLRDQINPVSASGISTDSQVVVATSRLRLMGYSCAVAVSQATPTEFRIIHGTAATHSVIVRQFLATNGSETQFFCGQGINAENGLYVDMVSGTALVVLFTKIESSV